MFRVQVECPCCRDRLHHCKKCWNRFHNGLKDNDYIPPEYYGQCMLRPKVIKGLEKLGIKHNPTIKSDKSRPYKEGQYH